MNDVTNYLEEQMNKHFEAGDKEKGAIYKEAFISAYRLHTIDETISHINKRLGAQEKLINEQALRIKVVSYKVKRWEENVINPVPLRDRVADVIYDIYNNGTAPHELDIDSLLDRIEELENKNK